MKKKRIISSVLFLLCTAVYSQIQGPRTVFAGEAVDYTYNDGFKHNGVNWRCSGCTVAPSSWEPDPNDPNDNTYGATVFFPNSGGSVFLEIRDETNDINRGISITVQECVTVFSLFGGGLICNTGIPAVQLESSQTGRSYQLRSLPNNNAIGSPLQGTGQALTWNNLPIGQYRVVGTNNSNGCTAVMGGVATISQGTMPTVYAVTSGGAYCAGSPPPAVTVNGTQAGVTYQVYFNDLFIGIAQNDGQGRMVLNNYSASGNGTITAIGFHTSGCQSNMSGSANVTQFPLPQAFNVSGGGQICSGQATAITLSNNQSNVTYQLRLNGVPFTGISPDNINGVLVWNRGEEGTYTVEATGLLGCKRMMNGSAALSHKPKDTGTLSSTAASTFYNSSDEVATTLTFGSAFPRVTEWQKNAGQGWVNMNVNNPVSSLTVSRLGATAKYRALVLYRGECPVAPSPEFTVTVLPNPVITGNASIPFGGGSATLSTQSTYTTYQWYKDDLAISGATASQLNTTIWGNYTVRARLNADPSSQGALSDVFRVGSPIEGQSGVNFHKVTRFKTGRQSVPGAASLQSLSPAEAGVQATYMDGLGRTVQQIGAAQSPQQKDVILPASYDRNGRTPSAYLPYTDAAFTGSFRSNAIRAGNGNYTGSAQQQFYANPASTIAGSTLAVAVTTYEADPLGRVMEQGAPGTEWQPGSTTQLNLADKTIKNVHRQRDDQVIKFRFLPDGSVSAGAGTEPEYYQPDELQWQSTYDENNSRVITYSDRLGRTLLKIGANEEKTYYLYDSQGRLAMVLSPEATKKMEEMLGIN